MAKWVKYFGEKKKGNGWYVIFRDQIVSIDNWSFVIGKSLSIYLLGLMLHSQPYFFHNIFHIC